jgi:hypothetical protein
VGLLYVDRLVEETESDGISGYCKNVTNRHTTHHKLFNIPCREMALVHENATLLSVFVASSNFILKTS